MENSNSNGPLTGIRVIEIAGQGPGPFAATILSDLGADVMKIDRADNVTPLTGRGKPVDFGHHRGRKSIAVDLKNPAGAEVVLRLAEQADALIEGFRPGVLERLGLGPDDCLARNPKLVYGRMTGWGQEGPWAQVPGHDINYLALTGMLHAIGTPETPVVPLNLVGDFGGGGMFLLVGILAAILEAQRSGQGQVVDASMTDGVALLGGMFYSMYETGNMVLERQSNLLDGGAPFYGVYRTSDDKFVSVGAIEPKFYALMLQGLGFDDVDLVRQFDKTAWPDLKSRVAARFAERTRDEWVETMHPLGVCFAPVLDIEEAYSHEQAVAREAFVEVDGARQPNVAPRFSRTPGRIAGPSAAPGEHTRERLADWGFGDDEIAAAIDSGVVVQAQP